jgi:hypothetical protein
MRKGAIRVTFGGALAMAITAGIGLRYPGLRSAGLARPGDGTPKLDAFF